MTQTTMFPEFEDDQEITGPIDLETFEALCAQAFDEREEATRAQAEADAAKAKAKATEDKILFIMEEAGKEKHHVKDRGLIYTKNYFNVSVPRDEEDRAKLFEYLEQKGLYDKLITINSQTLNSFYKSELDEAIERGDHSFKVPGITEPKHTKKIAFRKG